jgi:hypothetical protein
LSSAQLYKDANELMLNDEFEKALKVNRFFLFYSIFIWKILFIHVWK